jgi:hypothetical protein
MKAAAYPWRVYVDEVTAQRGKGNSRNADEAKESDVDGIQRVRLGPEQEGLPERQYGRLASFLPTKVTQNPLKTAPGFTSN